MAARFVTAFMCEKILPSLFFSLAVRHARQEKERWKTCDAHGKRKRDGIIFAHIKAGTNLAAIKIKGNGPEKSDSLPNFYYYSFNP
jgi:hypothetical protein